MSFKNDYLPINKLLANFEVTSSTGEASRLIVQGAVSIDGKKITSINAPYRDGSIIKVGKRRFIKVIDTDKAT